jgi:hypothetical protein
LCGLLRRTKISFLPVVASRACRSRAKGVFNGFPPAVLKKLMGLHRLILDVANNTDGVGG